MPPLSPPPPKKIKSSRMWWMWSCVSVWGVPDVLKTQQSPQRHDTLTQQHAVTSQHTSTLRNTAGKLGLTPTQSSTAINCCTKPQYSVSTCRVLEAVSYMKQQNTARSSEVPEKQHLICAHSVVLSTYINAQGEPSFMAEENDPKCKLHSNQ